MLQNTREAFESQLRSGHYNELRVALYFMLRGHAVHIGFSGQSFDLLVVPVDGRPSFKVEVKWDKAAARSGNIFLELHNPRSNRPSGLTASQADWWCHVVGEGQWAYLMPIVFLRQWLEGQELRSTRTQGKDSNSRGVLVPLASLAQERRFLRVDLPTPEAFFDRLLEQALRPSGPPA